MVYDLAGMGMGTGLHCLRAVGLRLSIMKYNPRLGADREQLICSREATENC